MVALVIETVARFIQSSAAKVGTADAAATVTTATPSRARNQRFTSASLNHPRVYLTSCGYLVITYVANTPTCLNAPLSPQCVHKKRRGH